MGGLRVVGAMEQKAGKIPNAAVGIFLQRAAELPRKLVEYSWVVYFFNFDYLSLSLRSMMNERST